MIGGVVEAQVAPEVALRAAELFDQGIERKKAGDLDGACAAFAESQALAPALGTQLNVAVCLERGGKLDEARAMLTTTIEEAEAAGDAARAQRARDDLAALEARHPPPAAETPVPAPDLELPAERLPIARPRPVPRPAPEPRRNLPAIAMSAGAVAVIGIGVGTLVSAHGLQDDADRACPDRAMLPCNRAVAQDLNNDAVHRSRVGVGIVSAGVAIGAAAGYLWWRGRPTNVAIAPAERGALLTVQGVMP